MRRDFDHVHTGWEVLCDKGRLLDMSNFLFAELVFDTAVTYVCINKREALRNSAESGRDYSDIFAPQPADPFSYLTDPAALTDFLNGPWAPLAVAAAA